MDCECQKNNDQTWPSKEDETGEMIFHKEENTPLFDRIINRREYDYSSSDEDDLFLEELTKKIEPAKTEGKKDDFLEELRADKHLLNREKVYDNAKEEHIRMKLYKLK